MRRSAWPATLVLLVAACAQGCASDEVLGRASSAIQGGADDATDAFAVGVCGGTPGSCQLICSGVLVAPNLVLTARHCVEDGGSPPIDCATATFGGHVAAASGYVVTTAASMRQATTGWHPVAQIVTPSGADQAHVCGDDIALLVLGDVVSAAEATPVTPNVATAVTDHAALEPVVTTIGYGLSSAGPSDGGASTGGYRRIRQDAPIVCIPGDPDPAFACAMGGSAAARAGELEVAGAACEGDSGSSAFEQSSFGAGVPLSVGVLARGGVDPEDPTRCVGGTYTRVDRWAALLTQTARDAATRGGYPTPAWAATDAGQEAVLGVRGGCAATGRRRSAPPILLAVAAGLLAAARRRRTRRFRRQVS